MKTKPHWFAWAIVAVVGAYLGYFAIAAGRGDADRAFHYREFAALPVQDGGRIKPFDTVARTRLLIINHRQTFKDVDDTKQPAIKWLLDSMSATFAKQGGPSFDQKIFRIENEDVQALLHLEPRDGFRYSINEFRAYLKEFTDEARRIDAIAGKDRSAYETKLMELWQHTHLYFRLAKREAPGVVPAQDDQWFSLADCEQLKEMGRQVPPLAMHLEGMLAAYGEGNVDQFNEGVKIYHEAFAKNLPTETSTARMERYFNDFEPLFHCSVLYALIFLVACVSWLGWFPTLNRAAFFSLLLIVLVHSWALLMRMYIQGRPMVFVTNLYSSAIFIGWGCVVVSLIFESFFRTSIALAVGAVTGGLSLFIAHFLSLDTGDTMEMMQAVLDTNFWLATHVTCITFGYTAMFVAGFMGVAYILLGVFTRLLSGDGATMLGKMIYGVLCFAMFLSFTGTVLGGIWADQSWGRFWGWDPKENGALLIVIWAALILHARWGGMVKPRGIAVLAVLGNAVTAWSWFGTNLLGVGLHSYGFMDGAMTGLIGFVLMQVAVASLGLLPLRMWASCAPRAAASPVPPGEGALLPRAV
jgi:ABC-type transport system involved in cytochrome c biogenesis permease subunit